MCIFSLSFVRASTQIPNTNEPFQYVTTDHDQHVEIIWEHNLVSMSMHAWSHNPRYGHYVHLKTIHYTTAPGGCLSMRRVTKDIPCNWNEELWEGATEYDTLLDGPSKSSLENVVLFYLITACGLSDLIKAGPFPAAIYSFRAL